MFVYKHYDKEKRLEKAWYKSSNVVYSECDDNENELKTLRVTFKNGATYQYSKVDVNDYIMFTHGGLDGSNGKALNTYIKPKYECTKLENRNIEELNEELKKLTEKADQNAND